MTIRTSTKPITQERFNQKLATVDNRIVTLKSLMRSKVTQNTESVSFPTPPTSCHALCWIQARWITRHSSHGQVTTAMTRTPARQRVSTALAWRLP
jgi:hypothetical protein